MSLTLKLSNHADFLLDLDLYADIVPDSSSFTIYASKVELKLKKLVSGLKWPQLTALQAAQETRTNVTSYPTSSRRPKNWDSLAKSVDEDSKQEKQEGESALNALFQSIYANASDDAKKAMNKSYVSMLFF